MMTEKTKILLIIAGSVLFLGSLISAIIFFELSWWILWGILITSILGGGGAFAITYFRKKPTEAKKDEKQIITTDQAKELADAIMREKLNDIFDIYDSPTTCTPEFLGDPNADKTLIYHIHGVGYNFPHDYHILINAEEPALYAHLINPSPQQIEKAKQNFAKHPFMEDVQVSRIAIDPDTGLQFRETETRRVSRQEKKELEEKKAEEEVEAL